MFTVEVGYDYSGYGVEGVWAHENLARLHARKIRRSETGDYVRIQKWQGQQATLVAGWAWDYNSRTRKKEWYHSGGQEDALPAIIEEKPHEYDPAFLKEMGVGS